MNAKQIESLLIDKLLTLNTAQLIKFMVVGLQKRHTEINMGSFGRIENDTCFGCAATNAILEMLGIPADVYISEAKVKVFCTPKILAVLERFYEALRYGESYISEANIRLAYLNKVLGGEGHFQTIKFLDGWEVPKLSNDFTEEDLQAYEKLADFQDNK